MGKKLRALYYLLSPQVNLVRLKRMFGKADLPKWFTFVVTYWCNSHCTHCNIWMKKPQNELKVEEIDEMFGDPVLRKVRAVNITGGEPFLRKDLPELVEMFEKRGVKTYGFISNGIVPKLIVDKVQEIAKIKGEMGVGISLDGYGEAHDKIRGTPGNFERCVQTLMMLKEIEGVKPKISFTLMKNNYEEFPKVKRLADELGVAFSFRIAQTGQYFDNMQHVFGFGNEDLTEIDGMLKEAAKQKSGPFRFLTEKMVEHERRKFQLVNCYSGFQSFFLDSEGFVFPCITLPNKVGNVREKSFTEIWHGKEFEGARKSIAAKKCSCWNGCETPRSIDMNAGYQLGVLTGRY